MMAPLTIMDVGFLGAAGGGVTCTTEIFSFDTADTFAAVGSANDERIGLKVISGSSAIGLGIQKFKIVVQKEGSPTGTCFYRVFDSSDTEKGSISFDVSTIPGTEGFLEKDLGSIVTIAQDDRIFIEYTGGDITNRVRVFINNNASQGDPIASGFNYTQFNSPSWADLTTQSPRMVVDSGPTCP